MTDDPEFDSLVELLETKALNPCPACGNHEWVIGGKPFAVPLDSGEGSFRAIALFCSNCGLMHLHNYFALRQSVEVTDDSTADNEDGNDPE